MGGMKTGKKIKVETLNFKLITESLDLAELQLKEGSEDLQFRLSHFRKRVNNKDKEKYDIQFFGKNPQNNKDQKIDEPAGLVLYSDNIAQKKERKKAAAWLKKIYRKIVSSTHPDKFANFPVTSLKNKYLKIYRETVDAWNNRRDDHVLLCAYETDIAVTDPKAIPILESGNNRKRKRFEQIQSLIAYQWHHIPEERKAIALENYLKQLGYSFDKEDVQKIVNLARKRKAGTRPKKLKKSK